MVAPRDAGLEAREVSAASDYDELGYPSLPRPETQPDRLLAAARLHGLAPPPPARARVLEVGCSDGGNLLATALAYPDASVVGIDLSPAQIARGREVAAALGAANLRLEVVDIRQLAGAGLGAFDVVVAHGVLSWVEPEVQDALLAALPGLLAPHGVAYVGTSVLPGAQGLLAVREWLRARVPDGSLASRVAAARALVELTAALAPPAKAALHVGRRDLLRARTDAWVAHELLATTNLPMFFESLVRRAAARGLRYLGDVEPGVARADLQLPPLAAAGLDGAAADAASREQLLDDLVGRSFRRALFAREDAPATAPAPERLGALFAAARLGDASGPDLVVAAAPPAWLDPAAAPLRVTAAQAEVLRALDDAWPRALPIADLGPHAPALLLEAHARGIVELWPAPPPLVVTPPARTDAAAWRPTAWALARARAADGREVVSRTHCVEPVDELERELLPLLDGTRDQEQLVAALDGRAATSELLLAGDDGALVLEPAERRRLLGDVVDEALARFGRAALLVE